MGSVAPGVAAAGKMLQFEHPASRAGLIKGFWHNPPEWGWTWRMWGVWCSRVYQPHPKLGCVQQTCAKPGGGEIQPAAAWLGFTAQSDLQEPKSLSSPSVITCAFITRVFSLELLLVSLHPPNPIAAVFVHCHKKLNQLRSPVLAGNYEQQQLYC